jgi:hypothetical protein
LIPEYPWNRTSPIVTSVGADGQFAFAAVAPGRYRIDVVVNEPANAWRVVWATAGGRDCFNLPLALEADESVPELLVGLSNTRQQLIGVIRDSKSAALTTVTIVVIERTQDAAFRAVRVVRPDTEGNYRADDLRPGEYLVVVLTNPEWDRLRSSEFLQTVSPYALGITLKGGEAKQLDLLSGAPRVSSVAGDSFLLGRPRSGERYLPPILDAR